MAEAMYRYVNNDDDIGLCANEDTNIETKDRAGYQHAGRTRISRVVAVSLGVLCFLLLAGIIGLQVNYSKRTGLCDSQMQDVRIQNSNLTEDYMQLQTRYDNLMERFNTMHKTLTAEKDQLQKEVGRLYAKATGTTPENDVWKSFNGSSYLITGIKLKTWSESRQHCKSNGADLVIINSKEEQDFLAKSQKLGSWIGLSDRASEETWQWVDGTVLQGKGFWSPGEPNDHKGNEDCAALTHGTWNDVPCDWGMNWICEK